MATAFIFLQVSLNLIGTIYGEGMCVWMLAFCMMRLIQFFGKINLAIQMLQSNVSCIALVTVSLCTGQATGAAALFATASTIVMLADAILGTAIFYAHNRDEIFKQLSFVKTLPIPRSRIEQTINIGLKLGGNIVELGQRKKSVELNNEYYQKV